MSLGIFSTKMVKFFITFSQKFVPNHYIKRTQIENLKTKDCSQENSAADGMYAQPYYNSSPEQNLHKSSYIKPKYFKIICATIGKIIAAKIVPPTKYTKNIFKSFSKRSKSSLVATLFKDLSKDSHNNFICARACPSGVPDIIKSSNAFKVSMFDIKSPYTNQFCMIGTTTIAPIPKTVNLSQLKSLRNSFISCIKSFRNNLISVIRPETAIFNSTSLTASTLSRDFNCARACSSENPDALRLSYVAKTDALLTKSPYLFFQSNINIYKSLIGFFNAKKDTCKQQNYRNRYTDKKPIFHYIQPFFLSNIWAAKAIIIGSITIKAISDFMSDFTIVNSCFKKASVAFKSSLVARPSKDLFKAFTCALAWLSGIPEAIKSSYVFNVSILLWLMLNSYLLIVNTNARIFKSFGYSSNIMRNAYKNKHHKYSDSSYNQIWEFIHYIKPLSFNNTCTTKPKTPNAIGIRIAVPNQPTKLLNEPKSFFNNCIEWLTFKNAKSLELTTLDIKKSSSCLLTASMPSKASSKDLTWNLADSGVYPDEIASSYAFNVSIWLMLNSYLAKIISYFVTCQLCNYNRKGLLYGVR